MKLEHIDKGVEFDFGKTAKDYSKYRDIYPESLYEEIYSCGIGEKGQKILDLGTGTGVFPRGMYHYGAEYYGVDISDEQIQEAQEISKQKGLAIQYQACSAENVAFPNGYFDAITAVQCFLYFNKEVVLPKIHSLLKDKGLFATVWMAWIPGKSEIARKTEKLVLKYNPKWQGYGYKPVKSVIPEWSKEYFTIKTIDNYIEDIPFSVDAWLGRIRACRGVAAALTEEQVKLFNEEHEKLLLGYNQPVLSIPHQILIHVYEKNTIG
jgi:cyclopropane fatty-acyl-phospholipid synthase-like methyltransferase